MFRIESDKHKYNEQNMRQLETMMKEFIEVADGKMNAKNMTDLMYI